MKKFCLLLAFLLLMTALVSCGKATKESVPSANGTGDTKPAESRTDDAQKTPEPSGSKDAKEFTALVSLDSYFVEFCLPEDHDGAFFTDMGANCAVTVDLYGNDVAIFHEYDKSAEIEKKTVGGHTFDYQKFNNMGLPDWRMYVIRIENSYGYYRFIYNVYAEEYDDAQVEKFMSTIRFMNEK